MVILPKGKDVLLALIHSKQKYGYHFLWGKKLTVSLMTINLLVFPHVYDRDRESERKRESFCCTLLIT